MAASEVRQLDLILNLKDQASKRLGSFSSELSILQKGADLAKTGILAIGTGILGVGAYAIKSAADMEKMRTALKTSFQGNAEEAKKAFDIINKFTAKTPFQLQEVMTGFIKLKNMGLDPSERALESYGNTASAMGKDLNMMVEAVADAATCEFERLKEFGIRASQEGDKVTFTFKGIKTTVNKDAKEIEKYLIKLGETEFAGGMEEQSKTLYGVFSTLKDQISLTLSTLAEESGVIEILKNLINNLATTIENNKEKVINWIKAWVEGMGGQEGIQQKLNEFWNKIKNDIIPAVLAFIDVVKDITKFIWEHREAIMWTIAAWEGLKLAMAISSMVQGLITLIPILTGVISGMTTAIMGPVGLVLAFSALSTLAIVGAIDAFKKLKQTQQEVKDSMKVLGESLDEMQSKVGSLSTDEANRQLQNSIDKARELNKEADRLANLGFWGSLGEGIKSQIGKLKPSQFNSVNDAIISPKGDIITTHPDDYLIATKNPQALAGGGGGVNVVINYPFVLNRNGADALVDVISQSLRGKLRI